MQGQKTQANDKLRITTETLEGFTHLGLLDKKVENGELTYEVTEKGARAILAWMGIPPDHLDSPRPEAE